MKNVLVLLVLLGIAVPLTTADAQIVFTTTLDGSQEAPPVGTTAKGTAWAVLSPDMKTLTYRMTYAQLSSARVGAHFHAGGTGGGAVVLPLSFSGNTVSGTWSSLPDSIVRHFLKGDMYVNVHSGNNPGGEIRGYFKVAQGVGFTVAMDGSQESPANSSTGEGTAWVVLDSTGAQLTYDVTVAGLSGPLTGGHFHIFPSGSVVHPITFVDSTSQGSWTGLPDNDLTALTSGNLYINAHSTVFPGGEIRGTVTPVGIVTLTTSLDGSQESPPVATPAKGTAWAVMSADMKTLTYRMTYAQLSSARVGAHFHTGGTGGEAVVLPLSFSGNTVSGTWSSLPDSIVRHFLKGDMYVNVHSGNNPGGEIRGYFKVAQGVGFTVAMDGSQESPANSSTAEGTAWVVLDSTGAQLTYDVTVAGLSGPLTGGHFHILPSGSVVHPITFVDSTSQGSWTGLPDNDLTALTSGNLYINAHSTVFPGGEIRGIIRYPATPLTGVEVVSQGSPSSFTLEQNYPNPFNPTTNIRFQLDKASPVTLKVYNVIGQEVASLFQGSKEAGTYEISFNASTLSSGVYFYRLSTASGVSQARKMMLLK